MDEPLDPRAMLSRSRDERGRPDPCHSALPRGTLLVFGIASLLLASLYVFGQRESNGCSPIPAWCTWAFWRSAFPSARRVVRRMP